MEDERRDDCDSQTMIATGMRMIVKNMIQPTMTAAHTARLKLKAPAAA